MIQRIITLFTICFLAFACKQSSHFEKALDPLEAGRNYLEGIQQGDFNKAHFYIVNNAGNESKFKATSDLYYSLDKEGRQQMRQAAIQINEIANIDPKTVLINYQLSFEGKANSLKVIETQEGWKVDLN